MKPKNIILITIDALRADHLGCYGYERDTTPNMDRLANDGILFKKAIANASYTTASITALQTSTYPLIPKEDYVHPSKRIAIAEILNKKGISTIGVHSNPWFSVYNYGKGFSKFVDPMGLTNAQKEVQKGFLDKIKKQSINYIGEDSLAFQMIKKVYNTLIRNKMIPPYAKAEEINNTVISYLKDSSDGFYLWIHYMDVHEPYIPEKFYFGQEVDNREIKRFMDKIMQNQGNVSSEERKILIDLYDNEIRYVDDKIGELLENLESLCDFDKTVLLITADHGQKLGERGYHGHGGANTPVSFFEELIHVPLIIWSKSKDALMDISESGEFERQVGLIDIAPTILDILGIPKPKAFMGESLLRNPLEKPIISQGIQCADPNMIEYLKGGIKIQSYRTNRYKLIYREDRMELYDLKDDPMELRDISMEQKEIAEKLKEELFNTLKSLEVTKRETGKTNIKKRITELRTQNKI
ncbi:MAG: 2,3-bisphosphoglycerate-independent phosphoglycerate mutase [Candidatus Argoarchaeum ethanivorans]|uniref:2,3-bisphosphoglycerate-independent phosphoglycerate mutase n=1 Tax=Candidatus Argoarchaeum ethanivorans TaxID=2608793 RepID=A0A811T1P2_9EURY|nr:MAG: 2,3-bisphosphoglycerate-independent phosphoglycerate mutase [Candidatus Argoarchaeum ethanivorans]